MPVIIKVKRGTTTQWNNSLTPLAPGELGYDTSSKVIKIGDGTTLWQNLLPLNKLEIDEIAQDAVYDSLTNFFTGTPNITVSYEDAQNSIILDVGPNVVLQDALTNEISALSTVYDPIGSSSSALLAANEYTDLAVSGLGNQIGEDYIPISKLGNPDGVAQLGLDGYVPDEQLSPTIARDSEIITSYNDLTDKPTIELAAVQWTANHYQLIGGANTRYLAGDIVWDGGYIYVANFDNESLPTTNTEYWSLVGPGKRLNIDGRDIPNILWDNILEKPSFFDGDYNSLTNLPTLFSGSYDDLTDKPTLFDGDYNSLTNLPILFSGSYDDLTDVPIFSGTPNEIEISNVSNTITFGLPNDITISGHLTLSNPPTQATHAATKAYVDNTTAGLNFHTPVHAATTSNLSAAYNNGTSGIGATLTSFAKEPIIIDEHALSTNERVLVKNQTSGLQNGIYVVTFIGDESNPWILTRATDADNSPSGEVSYGDFVFVQNGSINAGFGFIINTTGTINIGTTTISYVQFNAGQTVTAGDGLTESAPGTLAINTLVTADLSSTQTLINKTITGTFTGNLTGDVTGNVSGNAGTVTDGIYTTGSYSDPSWLTISKSKVGLSNVDNTSDLSKPVSTATQTELDKKINKLVQTVSKNPGDTVGLSDADKLILMASGGILYIPTDASVNFPIGTSIDVIQTGATQVTIQATTPATTSVNGTGSKLRIQWSAATIIKTGANSWIIIGDLAV